MVTLRAQIREIGVGLCLNSQRKPKPPEGLSEAGSRERAKNFSRNFMAVPDGGLGWSELSDLDVDDEIAGFLATFAGVTAAWHDDVV